MRLLLDTHALLWASGAPERLSAAARAALLADENDISFSIVSLWEIAIKTSLQRLDLASNWRVLIDEGRKRLGARWLPIDETHCGQVAALPWHHRDPFDRMLVAQAMCDGMTLVSRDRILAGYPVRLLW